MFFVIIYSVIDQGYIGLSLASCHKDEIWDLRAKLGNRDQIFSKPKLFFRDQIFIIEINIETMKDQIKLEYQHIRIHKNYKYSELFHGLLLPAKLGRQETFFFRLQGDSLTFY